MANTKVISELVVLGYLRKRGASEKGRLSYPYKRKMGKRIYAKLLVFCSILDTASKFAMASNTKVLGAVGRGAGISYRVCRHDN
jgi:hypothetical protein